MSYIKKEELIRRMEICAPMNRTDTDFELGEESQYKSDMEVIESCSEVKVIPIPPKATNGDMIKAMFPQYIYENITYKVRISENEWKPSSKVIRMNGEHRVDFELDWWNAPYNPQQNLSYTDKSGANIASQDVLRSAT